MKLLKRLLGFVWMVLGPVSILFLASQAVEKVGLTYSGAARTNTILQWGIILLVFIPIGAGLMIFGYYAIRGEYDRVEEVGN